MSWALLLFGPPVGPTNPPDPAEVAPQRWPGPTGSHRRGAGEAVRSFQGRGGYPSHFWSEHSGELGFKWFQPPAIVSFGAIPIRACSFISRGVDL